MKILMVFIDMLSAMNQGVCNDNARWNCLDDTFSELGGIVYSNCCSPAPDTPRSTAAIWTGLLPKNNGCDTRMKYSKYYLKSEVDSIWKMFQRKQMKLNMYVPKESLKLGSIPQYVEDSVPIVKDDNLELFLDTVDITENSVTYISLLDYHTMQSYIKHDMELVNNVYDLVNTELRMILSKLKKEMFDIVVVFSDHGCLPQGTPRTQCYDKRRTQIYLQIYKKGMEKIVRNSKLCSCMDIFPTLSYLLNEPLLNTIDGLNLFGEEEHPYLTLEDYTSFDHPLGQILGLWGVRYRDNRYIITDGLNKWEMVEGESNLSDVEIEECKRILSEQTQYKETSKALRIDALYKTGGTARNSFSTGMKFVSNWYQYQKVQDFAFINRTEIVPEKNSEVEHVEKIVIAPSKSNYHYYKYNLEKLNRYLVNLKDITGDIKEFSVCIYDFNNNKVLHYEQCNINKEYVFDFVVGKHCEKLAFVVYAGLMGKTANHRITIGECKIASKMLL